MRFNGNVPIKSVTVIALLRKLEQKHSCYCPAGIARRGATVA